MSIFITIVVLAILGLLGTFVFMKLRRKKLSSFDRKRAEKEWQHVLSITDPSKRLLEAEKVLDSALERMDVHGSFSEKLKASGARFKNIQSLWNAHKLRNRIAHEPGFSISEHNAESAVRAFEKALKTLF
ncbi:hypothetical protein A3D88_03950 [Candidatus Peribacteria bacterium RIFCSPHIGHO2_02_FULL_52_16]|nr:MAG: hypothetical protein A2706_05230 [Candidatus Peribacteria bacterium RIFCSPHIGHO2_01_FULL_51_35]OGJ61872.1 MAG: hypothetical protein A3D88_03950 [Candidatus Peribacteria bacterium RIFCSPHIGHO2_02_FULL_52_16]